jgi:CubicO group peptidase (beta-lactamase class C family)
VASQTHETLPGPLRDYLCKLMEDRGIPGLQVAVVRDGAVALLDTLGLANVEHQVLVKRESVFSINSMSKAFTGVAVMQLVENDLVDLSASISTYLNDLPEHWRTITVRQLATLTAGVPEIMTYTTDNNVTVIGDGTEDSAWHAAYAAPMEYPTMRFSARSLNA